MPQDADASYKLLFSAPEVVRDLVLGFIPDEWLHSLDYSTLEKMPGSYVTDDFRHRADDVVWRVRAGGEWVYLYLLIEFQSKNDPWMAVRIMTYVGLLYQDLIRAKQVLPGKKLPPVLPIVLYNGERKWTAATNIANLIPKAPGLVAQYLPQLQYLLIEHNQYSSEQLGKISNLVAAIMAFEQPESEQALLDLIDQLRLWLADNPELERTFAFWIRAVLLRQKRQDLVLPKVQDLKELKMTLAHRLDQWEQAYEERGLKKGRAEGRTEGRAEGESDFLRRLLVHRFGPLSKELLARMDQASSEQLALWGLRVLDARSLDEVFGA
ncbi:MAG: Rpn family recombination-promoting nuclease/putative transposase [Comamonas sp.]|nr:Rpn family recombination-promoting nuclease/putative transposase [Comamonas sp.]